MLITTDITLPNYALVLHRHVLYSIICIQTNTTFVLKKYTALVLRKKSYSAKKLKADLPNKSWALTGLKIN